MPNVHTPQRLEGESQADYKARREQSAAIVRRMRCVGIGGKQSSRELQRDTLRQNGKLRGVYGLGILSAQRLRNKAAIEAKRAKQAIGAGL